jgi:hypothetical protein
MVIRRSILYLCILLFQFNFHLFSQGIISGKVTEVDGSPIFAANISIKGKPSGTMTDNQGYYEFELPSETEITLIYSFVGYTSEERSVTLSPGERKTIDVTLHADYKELEEVSISARQERASTMVWIDTKSLLHVPGATGSIEALIKTLPGVSSSNELSSQYSVRGGNFDENLVYVNDVEIYRPFLVRSGQQEGLSFVNSDLVSGIRFSAGGFDAKYGDKMSSVLDITYRKPVKNAGSVSASLLGGSIHLEGIGKNKKFTYLTGFRYKTTSYLLNSLNVAGDYKPNFFDFQGLFTYSLNSKWEFSLLGNAARNEYLFKPIKEDTDFGTASNPLNLTIYYQGYEANRFDVYQGAFTTTYSPKPNLNLKFITSSFLAFEKETFDIFGEYLINELDNTIGSETYGDSILNIGIGAFLRHARNYLDASVYSASHIGEYSSGMHKIKWGVRQQYQIIADHLSEWELMDSTGYSLPQNQDRLELFKSLKAENNLSTGITSGFFQDTWGFNNGSSEYFVTAGIRGTYRALNRQFHVSPRATLAIKPLWEKDIMFRISAGLYYQPPFYKELRNFDGEMNKSLKSQQSTHFLLGGDYIFSAWNRPMKFSAELYYKDLRNIVPYKVDNVRLRYSGENLAKGYAGGLDIKLNGEFVSGAESWVSFSFMRTREDIENDFYIKTVNGYPQRVEPGYYPRPTDQLFSFGMFFQDYLPNNPDYKVHLNFLYGSRLPYSSPRENRFDEYYRLPPYRRVDIGFSKSLRKQRENIENSKRNFTDKIWISAEIFNLLGMNNTISYQWVRTLSNQENVPGMFATPNYLTSRRFNLKVTANF